MADSLELDLSPDDSHAARKMELGGDDPILDGAFDDFQLQDDADYVGFESPVDDSPRIWPWLLVVAILVLGGVGYWWWTGRPQPAPSSATVASADRSAPAASAEAPVKESEPALPSDVPSDVPALGSSDAYVRTLVGAVSSHPKLVEWLANDELVRRFTLVISNAAFDEAPALHVPFLRPRGSFLVVGQGETARIDPRSYARYDLLARVVASLDARGSVEAYRRLQPLVEEVYSELGYPGSFSETLDRALAQVESVPALPAEVDVRARVVSYEFANPELEQLPDFQKQLLRMGPDNLKLVKSKVREIRARLAS
jgi:hypothetical protein